MAPCISVIIPFYNAQAWLEEALESLVGQSFSDWEALCIDDASTDASAEIVTRFAERDARFRLISQTTNQGPSAARNRGMDEACGNYIAFLDADDCFAPGAFERLYAIANENDLDVLDFKGQARYESEEARRVRTETFEQRSNIDGVMTGAELFCRYQALAQYHCALYFHFIRREFLERIGLRLIEGIIHEDEVFSPLLHAQAQRAMFLNEVHYIRRIHEGSLITAERGIQNVHDLFVVQDALHTWIQTHANDYEDSFLEAFALRIFEMRHIMRQDMARCTAQELEDFQQSLDASQRVEFALIGTWEASAAIQAADEVRASRSYKLGDSLLQIPRILMGKPQR